MEAILQVRHAGCYTSRLTVDHGIRITVLSGHSTPEGSIGLWEIAGAEDSLGRAVTELASHPNIKRADIVQRRAGAWIVETLDTEAEVANALIGAGLVFLPPILIAEGTETYRVFALDRKQIDRAVRALRPKNEVKVLSIRERVSTLGPLDTLTEKQRTALEAAWETGWYDWPRRTDQTGLAERLGVSRPALSERLARAEANIMRALFGDE